MIACSDYLFHQREVGAAELALAVHGSDEHASERKRIQLQNDIEDVARQSPLPAVSHDAAFTHVGGNDDLAWEERRRSRHPAFVLDRSRALHATRPASLPYGRLGPQS